MTGLEHALAVCRFLQLAPALLLWGAFGYVAALMPVPLAARVGERLQQLGNRAAAVCLAATLLSLPLRTAAIGGAWADALDVGRLAAVLTGTHAGQASLLQTGAALLLVGARPLRRAANALTVSAAGLLLCTFGLTGHAVLQRGWPGIAHRVNDASHLLAAGAWLGSLFALLPALAALGDARLRSAALVALRRFSWAGHVAVAAVLATGAINTLLVLGHWPADPGSPYQRLLVVKISLVAVMAGLAVFNRYVLVPRFKDRPAAALRALRCATLAEIGLGLGAVALVAVIGLSDPA